MSDAENQTELDGSELGTKEYWDTAYQSELKYFNSHGDVGEVWFGEESALRVIKWLCSSDRVRKDDGIIDLGTGNGMMLVELAREGFTNLTGVDYCLTAVNLAQAIAGKQDLSIDYQVFDILSDSSSSLSNFPGDRKFQIVLDKGTYDAVSLHPEDPQTKRLSYMRMIKRLLRSGGLFILTSCNWTEDELNSHFQNDFKHIGTIPTPKYQFGGKTGSLVTSMVFEIFQ